MRLTTNIAISLFVPLGDIAKAGVSNILGTPSVVIKRLNGCSILRQIKELKSEYATINANVLRRVVQIHGAIPVAFDAKKPLRRTLLPGWLIIGGLPSTP